MNVEPGYIIMTRLTSYNPNKGNSLKGTVKAKVITVQPKLGMAEVALVKNDLRFRVSMDAIVAVCKNETATETFGMLKDKFKS